MIWTVLQINVRRLLHNRMELLLTFVVPIAFFSIFALIFGGGIGSGTTPKIKVVAVDELNSNISRAVIASLKENPGLRFMRDQDPTTLSREQARDLVRRGTLTMAIVLRPQGKQVSVDLLADSSDQVAAQVVTALVTRSLIQTEAQQFSRATELTASEMSATEMSATQITGASMAGVDRHPPPSPRLGDTIHQYAAKPASRQTESMAETIAVVDVIGEGKSNPVVSMYAAGIAVMFLLFGATGGGGALLEEKENQTLDRLLSTRMSMDHLLLGKWFYMTAIGVLQVTVMFAWAQIVFGVDLLGHFDGFITMTLVTALAASAFGLFLATLCRTRGQLNGLSVVLVLTMSALGGSMVPRYVMSEQLQQYGLCTFNAWALDGYDKVFWRELPVSALAPQLAVLMFSGLVFLVAARMLAVRWETE